MRPARSHPREVRGGSQDRSSSEQNDGGPFMSKTIPWETPMQASWVRSMELRSLKYESDSLTMIVQNDDDGKAWTIRFRSIQAVKVTTFECASGIRPPNRWARRDFRSARVPMDPRSRLWQSPLLGAFSALHGLLLRRSRRSR